VASRVQKSAFMRTSVLGSLFTALTAATLLTAAPAHADVTGEVVSLVLGGGNGSGGACAGGGYEPRQELQDPDGGWALGSTGYQVPDGFVLEVTDVDVTYGAHRVFTDWVTVTVQNRANASRKYVGFTAQIAAAWIMTADAYLHLEDAVEYISQRGTQHYAMSTGFLVSRNARLCIAYPTDSAVTDQPIRLRGRLHPVAVSPTMGTGGPGGVVVRQQ
jgi:hypothetical protein